MTLLRSVARPMLASMFVVGGISSIRNAPALADKAQPVADKIVPRIKQMAPQVPVPDDAVTLVRVNGAAQAVGGLMLATGHLPRLTSLLLAGTLAPSTLARHRFWQEQDPAERQNQAIHFWKNVSLAGGLLMASLDPDPHKKLLVRRAKDQVVAAKEAVVDYAT